MRGWQLATPMNLKLPLAWWFTTLVTMNSACNSSAQPPAPSGYRIIATFHHDTSAYTQGLVWHDGQLFESTGLYGRSQIRILDPTTGSLRKAVSIPAERFGEGLALLGDRLYQLTWQHQVGYVYDAVTLARVDSFAYRGEGWGLTTDGQQLIMSDGTDTIRYMDPKTYVVTHSIAVRFATQAPVNKLNELEYINGELFANIYQSDWIIRINPATGIVSEILDFAAIPAKHRGGAADEDVLNGIAYDPTSGHLLITGKRWRSMLSVALDRPPGLKGNKQ